MKKFAESSTSIVTPLNSKIGYENAAKAATRTVFGGGVGQMLQLAQSNLRNIPRP